MSSDRFIIWKASPEASEDDGANDDSDATQSSNNASNRLAPYNPTHATAQSAALDLLGLTPRDVFFDLGCGDGRLVVAALERCYDDDFLMRVHQERFARLRLHSSHLEEEEPPAPPPRPPRRDSHSSIDRSDSTRKVFHARSHSDYSVPHLMRDPDIDDSDLDVSVDHYNPTPYKFPHQHDNINEGAFQQKSHEHPGYESGSVDVLSALSPPSSQQQLPLGALTPATPVTPVVSNQRSNIAAKLSAVGALRPPPAKQQQHRPDEEGAWAEMPDIPKTIETPSPEKQRHAPQISELPTDSLLLQDSLATVPSGSSMPDDEGGGSSILPSWVRSNGAVGVYETNDDVREGVADEVMNGVVGGPSMGGGLRCVGIEYNQALADSAQSNVQKSYIYPHVQRKVCIRWGDVLEEWNRGREGNHCGDNPVWGESRHAAFGNENAISVMRTNSCDDDDDDAAKLTLLEDATAVFVYLLPQGLKKVKPLLYEAAVRRRWEQEQQEHLRKHQQQKQKQQYNDMLQHPLQKQSLYETEHTATTLTEDVTLFPLPRQLVHRKDFSHVSDITDYDFFSRHNSLKNDNSGSMEDIQEAFADMQRTALDGEAGPGTRNDVELPSFRVVSYMFSVPGWTAAKVDHSSKGGCALYLYENIHEQMS